MPTTAQHIRSIVDTECKALLKAMGKAHPGVEADLGISVALFYPQDPTLAPCYHYGHAGPGGQTITGSTVYAMGSVTKMFTAVLAACLSRLGCIGPLDLARVAPYLQLGALDSPYWSQVTFKDFATQTSGMPDPSPPGHPSTALFAGKPPPADFVAWWQEPAQQARFLAQRGQWVYSNPGFVTLGYALASAARQAGVAADFGDLLAKLVTGPLGMASTFVGRPAPAGAALSHGYTRDAEKVPITDADDVKSSAQDMHALLAATYEAMRLQVTGLAATPLQQALADTTQIWIETPQAGVHPPAHMGLGWQINAQDVLAKNGAISRGGSTCQVMLTRYQAQAPGVGIALMTNQIGCSPDATAHEILQQVQQLATQGG